MASMASWSSSPVQTDGTRQWRRRRPDQDRLLCGPCRASHTVRIISAISAGEPARWARKYTGMAFWIIAAVKTAESGRLQIFTRSSSRFRSSQGLSTRRRSAFWKHTTINSMRNWMYGMAQWKTRAEWACIQPPR